MNKLESRFQDLVDGNLSQDERLRLESAIEADPILRHSFQSYSKIIDSEKLLSQTKYELNQNFVVKVMIALEQEQKSLSRRIIERFAFNRRHVFALATVCVVLSFSLYAVNSGQLNPLTPGPAAIADKLKIEIPTVASFSEKKQESVSAPLDLSSQKSNSPASESELEEKKTVDKTPAKISEDGGRRRGDFESDAAAVSKSTIETNVSRRGGPLAESGSSGSALSRPATKQLNAASSRTGSSVGSLGSKEINSQSEQETAAVGASHDNIAQSKRKSLDIPRAAPAEGRRPPPTVQALADNFIYDEGSRETDGEVYETSIENESVSPTQNPISTFSIHVDTESYTNTRRSLQQGSLPPPNSVRTEEFLNYFPYSYPIQSEKPFALIYEVAPAPFDEKKYLLKLALTSKTTARYEVIAKGVKLQLEFNPKAIASYRLIGYENRKLRRENFDNDSVDAGDIGSGLRVTALYEIVLTNPLPSFSNTISDINGEFGSLKIRFKQPFSYESESISFPISREAMKDNSTQASSDFRFAASVAYFAETLKHSKNASSNSMEEIAALAAANLGEDTNGYRREFVELVKSAAALERTSRK